MSSAVTLLPSNIESDRDQTVKCLLFILTECRIATEM
jgi:hypothetical protein